MANHITYTIKNVSNYLIHFRYLPTYFKGENRAFYNTRNRQHLLIPLENESLTEQDIIQFFKKGKATDMPPEIEWSRFQIFMHSQNNNLKNQ